MMGVGPETGQGRAADDPTCGPRSHLIKTAGEGPKGLTIHGQEFAEFLVRGSKGIAY